MSDIPKVTATGCSNNNSKDEAMFNAVKMVKMFCEKVEYADSYKLVGLPKFTFPSSNQVCATIVARVICRFPG